MDGQVTPVVISARHHSEAQYDLADSGATDPSASGMKQAIRGRRDLPPPHTLAATGGISIDGRVKPTTRAPPADGFRVPHSRWQDTPTQSSLHASRRPASADASPRGTEMSQSASPAALMSTFPVHSNSSSAEKHHTPTPLRRQKLMQQAGGPASAHAAPRSQLHGTPATRSADNRRVTSASHLLQSYVSSSGARSRLLSPPQRDTFTGTPSTPAFASENRAFSSGSVRAQYLLEKPALIGGVDRVPAPSHDAAALQTVRSLTNALLHGLTPLRSNVSPPGSPSTSSQQQDDAPPAAENQALTLFIAQAMEYASRLKMQLAESEEKNSQYERQLLASPRGRTAVIPAVHRAAPSIQQLPSPTRSPRARSAPAWEFSLRTGNDARSPRGQPATATPPPQSPAAEPLPRPQVPHSTRRSGASSPAASPPRFFPARSTGLQVGSTAGESVVVAADLISTAPQGSEAPNTAGPGIVQPLDAPSLQRGDLAGGVNAEGRRPLRDPDARRIRAGHGEQEARAGRLQPSVRDEVAGLEQAVRPQGRQHPVESMQDGGSGGTREATATSRVHARLPPTLLGSPSRQPPSSAALPASLTLLALAAAAPRAAPGSPGIRGSLLPPAESLTSRDQQDQRVLSVESHAFNVLASPAVAPPLVAELAVAGSAPPLARASSQPASSSTVGSHVVQLPTSLEGPLPCSKCKLLQVNLESSQSEKALLEGRCSLLFTELSQVRSEFEQALSSNLQKRTLELDRESAMQMELDMLRANVHSLQHSYQDVSALLEKRTREAGEALLALAAERDAASSTAEACRGALVQLQCTVTTMQAELTHASERHSNDSDAIASLRAQLSEAKERAAVASHDRDSMHGLVAKFQEDLRQGADRKNALQQELQTVHDLHASLLEQIQERNTRCEQAEQRNAELHSTIHTLQASVTETLQERDQLRERLHEVTSATTQLASAERGISAQLEISQSNVGRLQRELAESVKQKDEQIQRMQAELRTTESSLESTERMLLEARASAELEKTQLQAAIQELQKELENAQSQTGDHASKLQEATDTLVMMMQQVELLQVQSNSSGTDVERLQHENEVAKETIDMVQESCNEWQRREMQCRAELQRADECLRVTTEDRNSLFDRVKELEGQVVHLQMEKHSTDATVQELMSTLTSSDNKLKLFQNDAQRLAASEQALRERLNAETIRNQHLQVELQSTLGASTSEVQVLALVDENAGLRAQLDAARETLAQLTDVAASLSRHQSSQQQQFPHQDLTDIKNEVERLQGDLQRSLSQVALLASERDALAGKVHLLETAQSSEHPPHSSIRAAAQVLPSSPIELAPSIHVPAMNAATPQRSLAYESARKTPSSILCDASDVNRFFDIALAGNLPPDEITWLLEHAAAPAAEVQGTHGSPLMDTRTRIDALPTSQLIAGLRVFMGGDVPSIPASDLRELAVALGDDFLNAVTKLSGSRNKPPVYPRR